MCDLSSSEEVEVVSRGCWAEQPQPCSSSLFKERHFSYSPVCWSQSGAPGPEASSRRRICGPSVSLDSFRLKRPAAYGPGLLRAGPSGEERRTPHHTVPVSPQCPQEIDLLTLPRTVFQCAAISSEHTSQFLLPGNVAELRCSPPLRGSLEQLVRPFPAGVPFQGTELASLITPEASLKRLVPLVDYLAAWKLLPNVSPWVLHTVEAVRRFVAAFYEVSPILWAPSRLW